MIPKLIIWISPRVARLRRSCVATILLLHSRLSPLPTVKGSLAEMAEQQVGVEGGSQQGEKGAVGTEEAPAVATATTQEEGDAGERVLAAGGGARRMLSDYRWDATVG